MLNNSTSGEIEYLQTNLMHTQANILRSELLRRNPDLFLKTLDQARKKVVSREFKEGHFSNKRSVQKAIFTEISARRKDFVEFGLLISDFEYTNDEELAELYYDNRLFNHIRCIWSKEVEDYQIKKSEKKYIYPDYEKEMLTLINSVGINSSVNDEISLITSEEVKEEKKEVEKIKDTAFLYEIMIARDQYHNVRRFLKIKPKTKKEIESNIAYIKIVDFDEYPPFKTNDFEIDYLKRIQGPISTIRHFIYYSKASKLNALFTEQYFEGKSTV